MIDNISEVIQSLVRENEVVDLLVQAVESIREKVSFGQVGLDFCAEAARNASSLMKTHFEIEETFIFPIAQQASGQQRVHDLIARLTREHGYFLHEMGFMERAVQTCTHSHLDRCIQDRLDSLLATLTAHARLENEVLNPLLTSNSDLTGEALRRITAQRNQEGLRLRIGI